MKAPRKCGTDFSLSLGKKYAICHISYEIWHMAFDQTDFPAISVNDETLVSLAFHYARPGSRRRGRWRRRLYNWRRRRRRRRSLLFLLFNYRSRSNLHLRAFGRAAHVGRSDPPYNRSRSRARNHRSRSRARNDRSRSRARNDRSRSRARDNLNRSRARDDRSRSRTAARTLSVRHAGTESTKRNDKRRQRS